MKPVIVTEALEVKDGKLTLNSPAANTDDLSPILNNGLAFSYETQQWFPVSKDETDTENKTWIVNSADIDLEGKKLGIQYTSLVTLLSGISNIAVPTTETLTIENKKAVLTHKPWNHYGMCPVLNLGYALVRKEDGSVMYLPTAPDQEDPEGKTIIIPIADDELHLIEDAQIVLQYLYENTETDVVGYPVIATDVVTITNGELTLSAEPNNLDDQYPFLNFGIVSTVPEEDGSRIQFNVRKVEGNVISIPDINEEDIALLEGKQAIVQYVRLDKIEAAIAMNDGPMSSEALGITPEMIAEAKAKAEGGNAPDIDMSQFTGEMTSEALGIDPEMLRKAREDAANRENNAFQGSVLEVVDEEDDDIVDGEFTEVAE